METLNQLFDLIHGVLGLANKTVEKSTNAIDEGLDWIDPMVNASKLERAKVEAKRLATVKEEKDPEVLRLYELYLKPSAS